MKYLLSIFVCCGYYVKQQKTMELSSHQMHNGAWHNITFRQKQRESSITKFVDQQSVLYFCLIKRFSLQQWDIESDKRHQCLSFLLGLRSEVRPRNVKYKQLFGKCGINFPFYRYKATFATIDMTAGHVCGREARKMHKWFNIVQFVVTWSKVKEICTVGAKRPVQCCKERKLRCRKDRGQWCLHIQ